jgi:hypothetical protein
MQKGTNQKKPNICFFQSKARQSKSISEPEKSINNNSQRQRFKLNTFLHPKPYRALINNDASKTPMFEHYRPTNK